MPKRVTTKSSSKSIKRLILGTVFLTGMASLVIEIVGLRLLSPYFGNTIFTTSSVITVFLAALSLGYYWGGIISEKRPEQNLFFQIIAVSGLAVLSGYLISNLILPILGNLLPLTTGPLIMSILAFSGPGILLGIVSPMAIKLTKLAISEEGVGKVAGEIFFWSTGGSILGSLLTGFVLIPTLGVGKIISLTGIFLVILGVVPLFWQNKKPVAGIFLVFLSILTYLGTTVSLVKKNSKILAEKDGLYEKMSVVQTIYNNRPVRVFLQDKSWSGAEYTDNNELVFEYTKYYNLYLAFKPKVRQVLVIGGGIYSIPKAIARDNPGAKVEVTEIEPDLPKLAEEYFGDVDEKTIETHIVDGRRYLQDNQKKYDLIFSDVYYSYLSIPAHFTTREFYSLAKNRLGSDGIFLANIIGSLSKSQPSLLAAQMKTFREVFDNSYFVAVQNPGSVRVQGVIFVGINGNAIPDWSKVTQMDLKQLINPAGIYMGEVPTFTDDYAPTDYYSSRLFLIEKNIDEGKEMLGTIKELLALGPRYMTASEKRLAVDYIQANLARYTKVVEGQEWVHTMNDGKKANMQNIIARFDPENKRRLIIATHYDNKRFADLDKQNRSSPVPGANDSGSGTALLLELARQIAQEKIKLEMGIDFVFFDGEEGDENIPVDKWRPVGSEYFVNNMSNLYPEDKPVGGIVLDMICDKDLLLKPEKSSLETADEQVKKFWKIGMKRYPGNFSKSTGLEIGDDHTPLNRAGIPTFLVIDFDYPYFHTTADTIDKCSEQSMEKVLDVLGEYLISFPD